ncbi:hypothetical protein ABH920_007196 [Catenulispora sp. EB89]|uniref:hypothetical protein n=1 Tax=Catenulispora sp. EB89 TaxID=3156257 RepID=UPI003519A50C
MIRLGKIRRRDRTVDGAEAATPAGRVPNLDKQHTVPYTDARAFLAGLSDREMGAGIRAAKLPLAVAVTDHVLAAAASPASPATTASSASSEAEAEAEAAVALAEAATAGRTVVGSDTIIRALLRLANPEVDRTLFLASASRVVWPARYAIVADRRGRDGRPVIDTLLFTLLVTALDALVDAEPKGGVPLGELVDAAAVAEDVRLARAALDAAVRLGRPWAAQYALATVLENGLRGEVWPGVRAAVEQHARGKASSAQMNWQQVFRMGEGADPVRRGGLTPMRYGTRDFFQALREEDRTRFQRLTPDWDAVLRRVQDLPDSTRDIRGYHGDSGVDAAAMREDMPAEVRAVLEDCYPRALWLRPRPDIKALRRALAAVDRLPAIDRHAALAELVRRGLVTGALTAAEVVATVRPAAETLALLVPGDTAAHHCFDGGRYAIPERGLAWVADRIRAEATAVLSVLGEEPAAWGALWGRVVSWGGTLPELVASAASATAVTGGGSSAPDRQPQAAAPPSATRHARTVDPIVALVSLAPPAALADILRAVPDEPYIAGAVAQMLDRSPLAPILIRFAFGPQGTSDMRRSLAHNTATDESTLWRLLLRDPVETRVLAEVFIRRGATDDLRLAALLRSHAAGGLHPVLAAHLRKTAPGADTVAPALVTGDPEQIHAALAPVIKTVDPGHRALAYAALAAAAGPEAVWALELARVGTLAKAEPAVQASVAAGDGAPLVAVVEDVRALMAAKRRALVSGSG